VFSGDGKRLFLDWYEGPPATEGDERRYGGGARFGKAMNLRDSE